MAETGATFTAGAEESFCGGVLGAVGTLTGNVGAVCLRGAIGVGTKVRVARDGVSGR